MDDCYITSEKLVDSYLEHEKSRSQLFGSLKNWFTAITSQKNSFAAIWRYKKVVPCSLESKKCSSRLFGASKSG